MHKSEVWGLRRLCLELAPEMINLLVTTDIEAFKLILDFLAFSLAKQPDSSSQILDSTNGEKWVRNAAMQYFGPIIH
jgi:hypothetical protein